MKDLSFTHKAPFFKSHPFGWFFCMVVDWLAEESGGCKANATALAGPEDTRDERFIFHTQGTLKKFFNFPIIFFKTNE